MTAQTAKKPAVSYDEVPYESYSYPATHAAHLYTIGRLFGMTPPDFRTAKVLEIGCASGGNIFPQALNYPKASFTGFDLSSEQIAVADQHKKTLGIKNTEFRTQNILDFDLKKEKGKYDYVIAHGIYSWVPENVRGALLDLCREALSPNGIAVVSYNTLPGWNAVRSLREMMMYHANRFTTPPERVAQARALLDFLLESVPEANASYRGLIKSERDLLKNLNDSYLFHDHLEDMNVQFYFHDFIGQARERGLDYVGDSSVASMYVGNMPQKALAHLKAVDDIVAQEQYMDFINNRRFRSTLLCRQGTKLNRDLKPEAILGFHLAPAYKPAEDAANTQDGTTTFIGVGGGRFSARGAAVPLLQALFENGARPLAADDLIAKAAQNSGLSPDVLRADLVANGFPLVLLGHISLHSDRPAAATTLSDKPVVWPLARMQASQPGCIHVTNVLGNAVKTDEAGSIIMAGLDGTRDRKAVVELLVKAIADGRLKATKDGKPAKGEDIRAQLEGTISTMLPKLIAESLLVG